MSAERHGTSNRRQWLAALAATLLSAEPAWAAAPAETTVNYPQPSGKAGRPLRLAVVPQLTPVEMYANWSPLVDHLRERELPCELIIYPSIADFETEFLQGKADVVYLNPYHMVMAHKARGYLPVLRSGNPLQGVLVVHKDSGIRTVEQLKQQRISFPAPNALAASLYIRAILDRDYRLPYEQHFAKNHRNAVRQVMVGDSAAAGVVLTTLELEPPEIRRELKVIYTTPQMAAHPLAVHPRVSPERRSLLVRQLKAMAADSQLTKLVDEVMLTRLTDAQYDRDYAALNRLGLERYVIRE
jgi:phosphonate transport system substrate-binding protein